MIVDYDTIHAKISQRVIRRTIARALATLAEAQRNGTLGEENTKTYEAILQATNSGQTRPLNPAEVALLEEFSK